MLKLADLPMREDFALGSLLVRPALRVVEGPAGEVHVEPLTMQVLLLLADAGGGVVTRNRLYDECWGGMNVGDYSLNRTITMVRRIAAEVGPGAFQIECIPRTGYRLLVDGIPPSERVRRPARLGLLASLAAVGLLLAIVAIAWLALGTGREPSVAVVESTESKFSDLAEGMRSAAITKAAMYQTSLHVLDAGTDADFIMNIRDARAGGERQIDLNLKSREDDSLLWSWSGKSPEANANALEQEARLIGASVLVCAAETRAERKARANEDTVKLYLDACSKFDGWYGADLRQLTDAFERVTQDAPQIRGAWSKLFASKAEAIEGLPRIDLVASLAQDIQRAAAHHIDVPELYIAKAAVLPPNARFERLQHYEAGLARFPTSPGLLAARSWMMRSLGRMDEAARTGERLAMLYPQSSAANIEYANSLMHSGRPDAARRVLERAANLAPDAPNLALSRFVLAMRYGDPKAALAMANSGRSVVEKPMLTFIQARISPNKENVDRAIDDLMVGFRRYPEEPGWVAQALATFGRNEEAIRFLLAYPLGASSGDGAEMLFRPPLREVRRDKRFMRIAQNFGVTDYWRKSGILPDFCYERSLPYDCREELKKLRN